MECEILGRYRYTGNRAETDNLTAWLLDRGFWFEVQLADDFPLDFPMWEITCGQDEDEINQPAPGAR